MRGLRLLLLALLLLPTHSGFVVISGSGQTVIRVPNDYPTIQQAVDAANLGDIVLVMAGTYYERITINRTLTLIGEDPSLTTIDGNGSGIIIKIDANNVVLDGFTIQNGGVGVWLNSHRNEVTNNKVILCTSDGVVANLSNYNIIRDNQLSNNGDGYPGLLWGSGINLVQSNSNIVSDNFIFHNVAYGMSILGGTNNSATQNIMEENGIGVLLVQAIYNNFTDNTVRSNRAGIELFYNYYGTYGNLFYHNNFVGNAQQEDHHDTPYSANSWNNSLGEGNYWSDYAGKDLDGDWIGDTVLPHRNVDYYPLMIPYGPTIYAFNASWDGTDYPVTIETDSAIAAFNFSQPQKQVSLNITRPKYAEGTCNVTIPKQLLQGNPWLIKLDGNDTTQTALIGQNATHTAIYSQVEKGSHTLQIIGTIVVPEFPSTIIMPLFMSLMLVAVVLAKKKLLKKTKNLNPQTPSF